MAQNLGTPKSLDEAIERAVASDNKDRAHAIIKDFLAQKFGIAMLRADSQEADHLTHLFKAITKREAA